MILKKISVLNYKNIAQAELEFSPKMNCFIGRNGEGKTNLLDAVYFLSFCKSATNSIDSQNIRHGEDFFMLQGEYEHESGEVEDVYCGLKRKQKKRFKRNKKEYRRLSEHIGLIPLVMVSPADADLISGGSEERRRFMDMVIVQYDPDYLHALVRYNNALQQRNVLLKLEEEPDEELMRLWEEMMAKEGTKIYEKRKAYVEEFIPVFQDFYGRISEGKERVGLHYLSHGQRGDLLEVIRRDRVKDRIMGYSLHGVHNDELEMTLGDFPIKREGSQGQNKTYLIALKLAQFDFLRRTGSSTTPLLLLDDIFDKLDAGRVEQIVKLVSGEQFGQIFVTDTNRDHLDGILAKTDKDYKLFRVESGKIEG
ncbi:MAG: DNA replication and repair protein RecF [Paraprevotella sp.]|nr:DNA replication and repair protein RecF [Paraprevotella sp.]